MWWDQSILKSLSYLYYLRVSLFHNLDKGDTFKSQEFATPIECPFATQSARTLDGTCNRNTSAAMGSANTRFGRLSGFNYSVSDEEQLLIPNPKVVAEKLLYRKDGEMIEETHVNLLAAAWIQFQTHDWFTHLNDGPEENPIKVPLENGDTMKVARTQKDPSWDPASGIPQTFINSQTTWWDLSQIYGQTKEFSDSIRTFASGKIKMDDNNKVPINPATGIEFAGVDNNWWAGLSMLHNLFTREHNSICDMLVKKYPQMSDEDIFQKARLINAAVNAKIHTIEWTPTLLQDDILLLAMNANWAGLPGFHGITGHEMDEFVASTSHQFPEEFVSAYRMHPMLPEKIDIKPIRFSHIKKSTRPILDFAFDKGSKIVQEYGLADMFNTLGLAPQGRLTLNNYPDFFNGLDTPNHPGQTSPGQKLDLATIEIIRDRERGIPRYNAYRESIGMERFTSISNITQDPVHLKALMEVYDGDIDKVDLLVGSLAEQTRPPGFGFSDTTFRVFIAIASRRLMADRFFTDFYKDEVYTKEGMDWIKSSTMKSVISRNIPELGLFLVKVSNPFIPWTNFAAQSHWLHLFVKSAQDLVKIGVKVAIGAMTGKEVLPK